MKRAWIILVLAAFGLLFIGGCKSKQAAEETQNQEEQQPDTSSVTAVPEEPVSAPESASGTSGEGQAPASSVTGGGQSGEQPASGKKSEAATSIEATGVTASPEAQPQATPVKKPLKIKKLEPQKVIKEEKSEEEND